MNLQSLLLVPCLLMAVACGMKGALERPPDPVPPSLYDRAFGAGDPAEKNAP